MRSSCLDIGNRFLKLCQSTPLPPVQTKEDYQRIDLSAQVISPEVISQIRAEDAHRFKVVPVAFGQSGLIVAVSDPLDIDAIDSLSFLLQREIELICASPEKIRQALVKYYGSTDEASGVPAQPTGGDIDFGVEITEALWVGRVRCA